MRSCVWRHSVALAQSNSETRREEECREESQSHPRRDSSSTLEPRQRLAKDVIAPPDQDLPRFRLWQYPTARRAQRDG